MARARRHTAAGALAVVTAAVMATAACAGGSAGSPRAADGSRAQGTKGGGSKVLLAKDIAMRPAAKVSYTGLAEGMRALGYAVQRESHPLNGNSVFSAPSLALPFAQLREGASGATAAQIDRVLHLPTDRRPSVNAFLHELAKTSSGAKDAPVVQVRNGLFADPSLPVRQAYLRTVKTWYDAGVYQVRFPTPALASVNAWAKAGTHGRVPQLFSSFAPQTKFVLANTTYLRARWSVPFDASDTRAASFRTAAGSAKRVQTMHRTGRIDYASGPGWQAVRLPYRGGQYSMWVLLPARDANPVSLLAPATLATAGRGFHGEQVRLSLPRWSIHSSGDLAPRLQRMGLAAPFSSAADFSGFTSAPQVRLGQVVQQASITVGEKGTVAAAASGVGVRIGAVGASQVTFTADHPFAYLITQTSTGVPLFEGTVGDPGTS